MRAGGWALRACGRALFSDSFALYSDGRAPCARQPLRAGLALRARGVLRRAGRPILDAG